MARGSDAAVTETRGSRTHRLSALVQAASRYRTTRHSRWRYGRARCSGPCVWPLWTYTAPTGRSRSECGTWMQPAHVTEGWTSATGRDTPGRAPSESPGCSIPGRDGNGAVVESAVAERRHHRLLAFPVRALRGRDDLQPAAVARRARRHGLLLDHRVVLIHRVLEGVGVEYHLTVEEPCLLLHTGDLRLLRLPVVGAHAVLRGHPHAVRGVHHQ